MPVRIRTFVKLADTRGTDDSWRLRHPPIPGWMSPPSALTGSRRRWIALAIVAFAVGLIAWGFVEAQPTRSASTGGAAPATQTGPQTLRTYLRTWEASWRRLAADLERGDDAALGFSDSPDDSWEAARRYYEEAAIAYRRRAERLAALSPPLMMKKAHDAYLAAVRRQQSRFQELSDSFAGTDPRAMEKALEALEWSQLKFDVDGARWEDAVIAACRASGLPVPEIVRRQFISNHQRTRSG
jgi:hypothetical protein